MSAAAAIRPGDDRLVPQDAVLPHRRLEICASGCLEGSEPPGRAAEPAPGPARSRFRSLS